MATGDGVLWLASPGKVPLSHLVRAASFAGFTSYIQHRQCIHPYTSKAQARAQTAHLRAIVLAITASRKHKTKACSTRIDRYGHRSAQAERTILKRDTQVQAQVESQCTFTIAHSRYTQNKRIKRNGIHHESSFPELFGLINCFSLLMVDQIQLNRETNSSSNRHETGDQTDYDYSSVQCRYSRRSASLKRT